MGSVIKNAGRGLALLLAVAGLTGCDGSRALGVSGGRDFERPDVFSVTGAGLWDGRGSLGGVWVAHPDVTVPERVMIRNLETGKAVTGALFRRELDLAGPLWQVSSDAGVALGMIAGAPALLGVVALRSAPASSKAEIEKKAPKTIEKPFIQVGIFNQKPNANRAAELMRSAGIVPTVLAQGTPEKPFWRVIVGPAASAEERKNLRQKIVDSGFSDAYPVTN